MGSTERGQRILVIAPTPFFADRGCHIRILGEAKALMALGNQLVLCTYHLGRDVNGIPTVRSMAIPWYRKLSPGPSFHKLYIDLLLLWKVLVVCLRFRPQIIHAHLHEGIVIGKVASKLFGIPMVADLQGSLTDELRSYGVIPNAGWFLRVMYWIERKIDHMGHHVIASSTHTAAMCTGTFGVSSQVVSPVIDGVDLDVFSGREKDPELRASLGIRREEKVVVFTGVLTEHQGIGLLLKALPIVVQKFPNVKFVIIGYPNEALYRQKAEACGVGAWTCFTGKVPYEQIPRYLALAHVAISPKISTTEANLKLLTYMAAGLPTVVFDSPINREILGPLGVYAKMGDPESLASALLAVLTDEATAKQLGEQGRAKAAKEYSWLVAGERLMAIYNSLRNHAGDGR